MAGKNRVLLKTIITPEKDVETKSWQVSSRNGKTAYASSIDRGSHERTAQNKEQDARVEMPVAVANNC